MSTLPFFTDVFRQRQTVRWIYTDQHVDHRVQGESERNRGPSPVLDPSRQGAFDLIPERDNVLALVPNLSTQVLKGSEYFYSLDLRIGM